MKKKILLISAVILISVGMLSISKIVQSKYLNKNTVPTQEMEKSKTVEEVDIKENDAQKQEVVQETDKEEETVKEEVVKANKDEVAKEKVDNKTVINDESAANIKTEKTIINTKTSTTEKVVVEKEDVPVKTPEPKKQSNLIIKDDITGKIILSINVNIENKTAGEITLSELNNKGIRYRATGRGETTYLTMINNIKDRDEGPLSGWCYYVNGVKPGVSCGAYKLKSGDVVQWKYLKDGVNN